MSIPFTICSRHNRQVIFVSVVILFSCMIIILICKKNSSLFDLCINISNKVILVFSCIALLCVFIVFMCSLCSTPIVLICILMCICRILITITYLLTYLLTYNVKPVLKHVRFFRFLTFYPFADKNSVVSSYFIVEKRVFCGDI